MSINSVGILSPSKCIASIRNKTSSWTAFEPPHDKTNKMISAHSEDSDQPGHPPRLISDFAVHLMGS